MRRNVLASAIVGIALFMGVLVSLPQSTSAAPSSSRTAKANPSPEPQKLPEAARDVLRPWMQSHRTDVDQLLGAVLHLDYKRAQEVATNLANDPHLARPSEATWDSVNNAVPRRFYELQDAYLAASKRVADSARAKDSVALGRDFGGLMQTCVACHAAYMPPKE